nr:unnamed protein product [uncultured bacterium]
MVGIPKINSAKVMKKTEMTYVGIDFSKEKFNACVLVEDEIIAECELENKRCGFHKLTCWLKKVTGHGKSLDPSQVVVCGEHTGTCSTELSEYLYGKGYIVWLQNPVEIKRSSGINRGKDDRADARMIAEYAYCHYKPGKTILFKPDSNELKELRSLYMYRQSLVRERVALGNQIKSRSFDTSPLAKRSMASRYRKMQEEEKSLQDEIVRLMKGSEEFSRNYAILTSFKGIGPITAALLIVFTGNFTKFASSRKFACFCGTAPFRQKSGTSIDKKPHVSHFAHIGVKSALVQACRAAIRDNGPIREYARRLREKGKHEGVIMNNVKNKMLHILFKMIETQTFWDAGHQYRKEAAKSISGVTGRSSGMVKYEMDEDYRFVAYLDGRGLLGTEIEKIQQKNENIHQKIWK